MTDQFEIDEFILNIDDFDSDLDENSEENEFETDDFEKVLAEKYPELADEICELDENNEKRTVKKSKKKQAKERLEKLEGMMKEGRSLFEKRNRTILETGGPMDLLAKAVRLRTRVEVRVRSAVRVDRIFHGTPITFDEHFNVMLQNVTETVLRGRTEKQKIGDRNRVNEMLPDFLRWKKGATWPMPHGSNALIEHRFQRSCFVKGDSVVLIRALNS